MLRNIDDDDDADIDGKGDDDDDDKVVECHCFTAGGARKLHVVLVVHTPMQSSQESLIYCLYSPKNWQIPIEMGPPPPLPPPRAIKFRLNAHL